MSTSLQKVQHHTMTLHCKHVPSLPDSFGKNCSTLFPGDRSLNATDSRCIAVFSSVCIQCKSGFTAKQGHKHYVVCVMLRHGQDNLINLQLQQYERGQDNKQGCLSCQVKSASTTPDRAVLITKLTCYGWLCCLSSLPPCSHSIQPMYTCTL